MSLMTRNHPLLVAFIFVATTTATLAADWPGFRGHDGQGTTNETTILSTAPNISLRIRWMHELGSGYSGAVVADGRVVTIFSDGKDDVVAAFDNDTGRELWRFALDKTYEGHDGSHTGAISTPLVANATVYALAPRGRFVALKLADGALVWSTDLAGDHHARKPHYGFGTSPIHANGLIVIQLGAENASLAAFDAKTGEKRWTRGSDGVQYQSPIVQRSENGSSRVIATGNRKILALNPSKGDVVWEHEHGGRGMSRGVPSLTPVSAGKRRFFLALNDDSSTMFTLDGEATATSFNQKWNSNAIRNSFNIPVYHDEHIYAFSSRFLTCVNADTGDSVWKSRDPGDGFFILVDGHLIIATKEGSLHIADATTTGYEERAALKLFDDLSWSHPAFSDNAVYLKGVNHLVRVDITRDSTATPSVARSDVPATNSEFGAFLKKLASTGDKQAVVDQFIAAQKLFPVVEKNRVHFIYSGEGTDLAVAGDLFGARQEKPMTRVAGTNLFYHSMPLESDARANYIFMRDYTEILDPRNDRKTTTNMVGPDMELSFGFGGDFPMSWFAMPDWKAPNYFAEPKSTGRIISHEIETATSAKIPVDVYLPAGYDDSDNRYPVAYVHGGQAAITKGGFIRALDNLTGREIPPIIVVFIKHQPNMFAPDTQYPEFFTRGLIPFIDKTFRTQATPESRASIGQGFAGALAIKCAAAGEGKVARVGCQSPFFFGPVTRGFFDYLAPRGKTPMTIYLEWGKYDLRNPHENWDMARGSREFAKSLADKGYKYRGGEVHDGTDWPSWRNRYDALFSALFPPQNR